MSATSVPAALLELVTMLSQHLPYPIAVTVTVASGALGVALALWGFLMLLAKITTSERLDALARLLHVRGRTRAENTLADALAGRGSPAQIIQGMEVLRVPSPLEAPGANLYIGDPEVVAVPAPRPADSVSPPRVVVHRSPTHRRP